MAKNHQPAHVRTPDELREHLGFQMGHLRRSCEAYDNGEHSEAQRLAATCYLLVHDPVTRKPTKSLLLQLGLKSKMIFVDSSNQQVIHDARKIDPARAFAMGQPLITVQFGGHGDPQWVPVLERGRYRQHVKFQAWWEGAVYINWQQGPWLSRKNLVCDLRNQDGGGHVDGHIRDPAYKQMSQNVDERVNGGEFPRVQIVH